MKALVVGAGNIGMRYIENLRTLGYSVVVVETDEKKSSQLKEEGYEVYGNISEVRDTVDFVIVATPTDTHLSIAQVVSNWVGMKGIFIEKPLSYNMDGVDSLIYTCKANNIKLMCGCNLRFHNGVSLVKTLLNNKSIGDVVCADYTFGHDLTKWHPDTDYTQSYSAGEHGGILLDDIHAIDLFEYLFGEIKSVKGSLHNSKTLNIKKEDIADYILEFNNGIIGRIHSDYINIEYTRNMYITGTGGSIIWDFAAGEVLIRTPAIDQWRIFTAKEELNEMYIREMQYFIGCIEQNVNPMSDGVSALEVAMELKESTDTHEANRV